MAWETRRGRGRYWTRSRRVNGRVVREYVGTGQTAELAAQTDALEREKRRLAARELRQTKDELAALDAELKAVCDTTDLAVRAALLAAGFHCHKRGEWRRRRDQEPTGLEGGEHEEDA